MSDQLERNKEIARQFFAALSVGDARAVIGMYADDFTLWTAGTLPFSGSFTRAQAEQTMGMIFSAFPEGIAFTISAITAEGDRVAVEAESRGRHVSGKTYNNRYHFLLVIRNDKVAQLKEYLDTMHAHEVLVATSQSAPR